MTVQKSKDSVPTVISKDEISKLTVGWGKVFENTATLIAFSWLDDSRIRQNQLGRLQMEMKSTQKRQ